MAFEEMSGLRTSIKPKQVYASFDAKSSPAGITSHRPSASLLKDTPPSIIVALSQLAPIVKTLNTVLALVTWTGDDNWSSFLLLASFWVTCLYGDLVFHYAGNWLLLLILGIGYFKKKTLTKNIVRGIQEGDNPITAGTEDTQKVMDRTLYEIDCLRARYHLLSSSMAPFYRIYTWDDPKQSALIGLRLALCTPVYVVALYFFTNRALVLLCGTFFLTFTSPWFKVICTVSWRLRTVRKVASALVGVEYLPGESNIFQAFSGASSSAAAGAEASAESTPDLTSNTNNPTSLRDNSRFTTTIAVIENQRRWLGLGWTPSLLPHERAPYTDVDDRPGAAPENTALPAPKRVEQDGITRTVTWKWIDPEWRIETDKGRDPNGWLYFDNAWRHPSVTEEIGRYTRCRKWIRNAECAEIVHDANRQAEQENQHTKDDAQGGGREDGDNSGNGGTGHGRNRHSRTLDPEKVRVVTGNTPSRTSTPSVNEKQTNSTAGSGNTKEATVVPEVTLPKREWREVNGGGRELVTIEPKVNIKRRPFGRKNSRASVISVGVD